MALPIGRTPTLSRKEAMKFEKEAEAALTKKLSDDEFQDIVSAFYELTRPFKKKAHEL